MSLFSFAFLLFQTALPAEPDACEAWLEPDFLFHPSRKEMVIDSSGISLKGYERFNMKPWQEFGPENQALADRLDLEKNSDDLATVCFWITEIVVFTSQSLEHGSALSIEDLIKKAGLEHAVRKLEFPALKILAAKEPSLGFSLEDRAIVELTFQYVNWFVPIKKSLRFLSRWFEYQPGLRERFESFHQKLPFAAQRRVVVGAPLLRDSALNILRNGFKKNLDSPELKDFFLSVLSNSNIPLQRSSFYSFLMESKDKNFLTQVKKRLSSRVEEIPHDSIDAKDLNHFLNKLDQLLGEL